MQKLKNAFVILAGAAAFAPLAVQADDTPLSADKHSDSGQPWKLASDVGISVTAGGGVTGFTDKAMRDVVASDVGGLWGLRVTYGSHMPFAVDINYAGTAANIHALTGSKSGTLIGTTLEAAVRYNVLPNLAWNPYAFAGMGWQRYDVTGTTMHLWDSGMASGDNSTVFPFGAGVAYRAQSGLVVDVHGTFRLNVNPGLVMDNHASTGYVPMHTWEASGGIGYEF
ncbi:MAG TPA: outer membrane beta-barrel protein [Kofleriaceae bacterium]|jgi:hypothetical protein|nr:outer membrane beta-barrel protein [Kofleriaceae bacterium]